MPTADPYADLPDRTTLADEAGEVLLVFSRSQSLAEATPWATGAWVPGRRLVVRAGALALQAMAGWMLSTSDPDLVTALRAGGATEVRHVHRMTHDLESVVPRTTLGGALAVHPLTPGQAVRHAARLGAVAARAYPPGHPDPVDADEPAAVRRILSVARGEVLGPLTTQSRVAVHAREIVGACLVVDRPGTPPYGGPWVIDVFRDPRCPIRGIGEALLRSSLAGAASARLAALSLSASDRNERARRLYRRLGFVAVNESWTLALP